MNGSDTEMRPIIVARRKLVAWDNSPKGIVGYGHDDKRLRVYIGKDVACDSLPRMIDGFPVDIVRSGRVVQRGDE